MSLPAVPSPRKAPHAPSCQEYLQPSSAPPSAAPRSRSRRRCAPAAAGRLAGACGSLAPARLFDANLRPCASAGDAVPVARRRPRACQHSAQLCFAYTFTSTHRGIAMLTALHFIDTNARFLARPLPCSIFLSPSKHTQQCAPVAAPPAPKVETRRTTIAGVFFHHPVRPFLACRQSRTRHART